jgi:hypothetical protein
MAVAVAYPIFDTPAIHVLRNDPQTLAGSAESELWCLKIGRRLNDWQSRGLAMAAALACYRKLAKLAT